MLERSEYARLIAVAAVGAALLVSTLGLCFVYEGVVRPLERQHRQPQLNSELVQAAMTGDFAQAEELVRLGAEINAMAPYYPHADQLFCCPLFATIDGLRMYPSEMTGRVQFARWLLGHGAKVDTGAVRVYPDRIADEASPLCRAAGLGEAAAMRLLIRNGANVNWTDPYGFDVLFYATQACEVEAVRLLIDAGANVRSRGTGEGLIQALSSDEETAYPVVRMLLAAGADPDTRGLAQHPDRPTLLMAACGMPLQAEGPASRAPKVVRLLLAHGANRSLRDASGHTALWGAEEMVRLAKADGGTPDQRYLEIIRILRRAHAKP